MNKLLVGIVLGGAVSIFAASLVHCEETNTSLSPDYKTAQDIIHGANIDGKAKKHHWWQFLDVAARRDDARETTRPIRPPYPELPFGNGVMSNEASAVKGATSQSLGNSGQDRTTSPMLVKEHKPVDLTEGLPPVDHPFTFAADIQKAIFDAVAAYVPGFAALPEEQKSIVAQVNMMAAVVAQGGKGK